ncbi:MFS transporter [Candidatus Bathyarchaeota archaeon]|nr:MFS transporter [Candidatus Bathyarchaeota archaeon]MBL7168923.1 MFS transporter [Candidatus Bathyarchaeota archaeon]
MGFLGGFRDFLRAQSRNFKVFLARDVITTLFGNMAGSYASIYMYALGASAVEIGALSSTLSLVRTLLSIPGGILTDRVKRIKGLYLLGRLAQLPINLVKAFAQTFNVYFFSRIWETVAFRVTMPTANIINIASLRNEDRVKGLVLRRTIISAVGLVAPLIAAYAITYFGGLDDPDAFRPLFLIQFVVSLVVFGVLAMGLEEPEFERSAPEANVFKATFGILRQVPGLKMLLLLSVVRTFFINIRMPYIQLYAVEIKNADAFILGFQGTISTAVTLFFSAPIGELADKVGRRRLAYASQVVMVACLLAAVLTPPEHPEWLLLYSFLASLGGAMDIGWWAFEQEYVPLSIRGRWSGLSTMVTALVGVPAPYIGGLIWEYNPDLLWWLSIVFYLFLAIPLRMMVPDRKEAVAEDRALST